MQTLSVEHIRREPAAAPQSDLDLAQQAMGGDAVAFETIVRRHNRLLFRTARGVVPDDAEAQDVVQETYLRAFVSLRSFRGDSSLGTWLARIAINVALRSRRSRGRILQLQDADAAEPEFAEHAMTPCAYEDDAPDARAERGEIHALLQAGIAALPVKYRSVFMFRAVQEMSVEETAYCLQLSEDVVRTRYLRARTKLRESLSARIEAHAPDTFAFAGARCDDVAAQVMAQLVRRGLVRLH